MGTTHTAYLVGFMDKTSTTPKLERVFVASESATTMTVQMSRVIPVEIISTVGKSFQQAKDRMLDVLVSLYETSNVWRNLINSDAMDADLLAAIKKNATNQKFEKPAQEVSAYVK